MRRISALVIGLVGCGGTFPPADIQGAHGALDAGDPACTIYPTEGYASIDLDFAGRLVVEFPRAVPNVWTRGTASYAQLDDGFCEYYGGSTGVRVQYGDLIDDPECDICSARYRPLFVGEMSFDGGHACATPSFGCPSSMCLDVAPTSADSLAMWCDSPDEANL